jgi:hypothetical protein
MNHDLLCPTDLWSQLVKEYEKRYHVEDSVQLGISNSLFAEVLRVNRAHFYILFALLDSLRSKVLCQERC